MIDEREAMTFLLDWTKWGLNQVLVAWDFMFTTKVDENAIVDLLDDFVFGNLQGVLDNDMDLSKIMDDLGGADIDSLFRGDL